MNRGYQRMLDICRRDRDVLLSEYCARRKLDKPPIPATVADEIIKDVLELDLVWETLGPKVLGETDYDQRLIRINESADFSQCPKADREGIESFTKGHEIGHWRVFGHEAAIRAEVAEGQLSMSFMPSRQGSMIVCRAPWDADRHKLPKEQQRREFQADTYASAFLVPEAQLVQQPEIQELIALGQSGKAIAEAHVWRLIYPAAARFLVSPTMMKNVLTSLGIVAISGGRISLTGQCSLGLGTKPTAGGGDDVE